MRVLVTGAAGFLGRHVVSHLLGEGWDVSGFDLTPNTDLDCPVTIGDLRDGDAIRRAVTGHEIVCHIGAVGDVYLATRDPALAAGANVVGCANVASAASEAGARVVYASTWEVYGRPEYEPIDETHPCRPDHPYSITKLAGEQLLLAADRLQGVPVLALRLGTAYGPGMRSNSVFRIFIDRARRGEPITIQGDGSQRRQFTHTSDIARAFELACVSETRGQALNVVSPQSYSIKELAELVIDHYPTEIRFEQERPGDVSPALVSARRASEMLGWRPRVDFAEGLGDLLEDDGDS